MIQSKIRRTHWTIRCARTEVMRTQKVATGINALSTNKLARVVYILEFKSNDGITRTKIVKD